MHMLSALALDVKNIICFIILCAIENNVVLASLYFSAIFSKEHVFFFFACCENLRLFIFELIALTYGTLSSCCNRDILLRPLIITWKFYLPRFSRSSAESLAFAKLTDIVSM